MQSHKHQPFIYLSLCLRNLFYLDCCLGLSQHRLINIVPVSVLIIRNSLSVGVLSYHLPFLHVMRLSLVFGIFLLLVPPPFVHLRLWQSCQFRHLNDLLLTPVRLTIQLSLQDLNLSCTLSFPLPHPTVIFIILLHWHTIFIELLIKAWTFWHLLFTFLFLHDLIFKFIVEADTWLRCWTLSMVNWEKLMEEVLVRSDGWL